MAIPAIIGILHFKQAVRAGELIHRQVYVRRVHAVAVDDVETFGRHAFDLHRLAELRRCEGGRAVDQMLTKTVQRGRVGLGQDFHRTGTIPHPTRDPQLTRQSIDERTEADPLNLARHAHFQCNDFPHRLT